VINYNSPGATGAPAFAAHLYRIAEEQGYLEGIRRRAPRHKNLTEIISSRET